MKIWPFTIIGRGRYDELLAAAAAGEVDAAEAVALERERDDIRFERNRLLAERAELQNEVADLTKALESSLSAAADKERTARDQVESLTARNTSLRAHLDRTYRLAMELSAELAVSEHGHLDVYVLTRDGRPVAVTRSIPAATVAAKNAGMECWKDPWEPTDKEPPVTGWFLRRLPLQPDYSHMEDTA